MYIIKTHYEATAKNTNRAGAVHEWYFGRGGVGIGGMDSMPGQWELARYGYQELAHAKTALRAAQKRAAAETDLGWWKVTAELVEV